MEVAIFSEGDADEAGLRVLVDAILGSSTLPTKVPFRSRGWPAVADQLSAVIRATYLKTDAVGLVVVADGNGSSLEPRDPTNRLVRLQGIVAQCRLHGRPERKQLRIALGIAYPCIEAWWLAGESSDVSERAWTRRTEFGSGTLSKQELKFRLYGTEFRGTPWAIECMKNGAMRSATKLPIVRSRFPYGLEPLIRELESWR